MDEPVETAVPALKAMADGMPMRTIGSPSLVRSRFRLGLVGRVQVVEERTLVDPGSVGDWIPALLMVAALGGLAAACGYALWQDEAEAAAPRRLLSGSRTAPWGPAPADRMQAASSAE